MCTQVWSSQGKLAIRSQCCSPSQGQLAVAAVSWAYTRQCHGRCWACSGLF